MTRDEIAHILREGDIDIVGRIQGSSNQALLVDVTVDDVTLPGCYKTEVGERPLWDFPDGLWRREVAAWQLSHYLALDLVPVTVVRRSGPYAPGSIQLWINDATDDHYFTLRDRPDLATWFRQLCLFDLIANNADRKSGHVLYDSQRCWAIDNGLTFALEDKVRTVLWDFADEEFTDEENDLIALAVDTPGSLFRELLTDDEVTALRLRARTLQRDGRFPSPRDDGDWPPYPWPLV